MCIFHIRIISKAVKIVTLTHHHLSFFSFFQFSCHFTWIYKFNITARSFNICDTKPAIVPSKPFTLYLYNSSKNKFCQSLLSIQKPLRRTFPFLQVLRSHFRKTCAVKPFLQISTHFSPKSFPFLKIISNPPNLILSNPPNILVSQSFPFLIVSI